MNEIIVAILRSAQFTFVGRVGSAPEVKYFQSGACNCKFSIAVNRGKKNDNLPPDWFKIEAWSDLAVEMGDTIKKGDLIEVTGRVTTESWKGRDDVERLDVIIKAERWSPVTTASKPTQSQAPANEFGSLDDDYGVPF
jgi:single-strand DNA-binding protein